MERSTDIWRFNRPTIKMKEVFTLLLNIENYIEELRDPAVQPTKGPLQLFSMEEVHKQLGELGLKLKCWRHPAIQINYSCSNWTISN